MELKRIIARDSRSANEKAIQMYGPDVLVISSQRVDNQTELIVAVETDAAPAPAVAQARFEPMAAVVDLAPPAQAFSRLLEGEMAATPAPAALSKDADKAEHDLVIDALTALSRRVAPKTIAQPMPELDVQTQPDQPVPAIEPPSPLQSVAVEAAATPHELVHDFRRSQETVELLRQEMAALRQEFVLSRQMTAWQGGLGLAPDIEALWNQLLDLGMPARLRSLLLDSVRALTSVAEARAMVGQLLTDALVRQPMALPEQGMHALCGPSGSGKTLMLVRLAKQACQSCAPEQQAIISYCDQRPGAWSQLQVLAAQTGVECFKANDVQTLKLLLDDLSGRQLIWIDTPGTEFMTHAATLAQLGKGVQLHAVLPVDATVTSVQKVLESQGPAWASLMLSKLDEAAHPWPLIQGLCNNPLPISVVSQGASLSLAATSFQPAQLVDMALAPLGIVSGLPMTAVTPKKPRARRASPVESVAKTATTPRRSRASAKVLNG